jgi:hypothetical protein
MGVETLSNISIVIYDTNKGIIQLTMNYFLKPIFCKFSNIHHSSKDVSKGIMLAEVIIMVTQ